MNIDQYRNFNESASGGVLIWQWSNRGFGSELLAMLLGMLYAAENDLQFMLCSKFSNIAVKHGWSDYFESFCLDARSPLLLKSYVKKSTSLQARILTGVVAFANLGRTKIVLTHQIFNQLWNQTYTNRFHRIDGLGLEGTTQDILAEFLHCMWRPNAEIRIKIEQSMSSFGLVPGEYIGVHIRRGDKVKEARAIPVEAYRNAILSHIDRHGKVFVATDDIAVIEQLSACIDGIQLITYCTEQRRGHHQKQFNRRSKEEIYNDIIGIILDVAVLSQSATHIGTFSSNLSRMVYLLKAGKNSVGLDGSFKVVM